MVQTQEYGRWFNSSVKQTSEKVTQKRNNLWRRQNVKICCSQNNYDVY